MLRSLVLLVVLSCAAWAQPQYVPTAARGSSSGGGMTCELGTVSYASLTANATTQEVTIKSSVAGTYRYNYVLVNEATQVTGTPTLKVSMGQSGVGNDLVGDLTLKVAGGQSISYDTPRPPVVGAGTYNIVLLFTASSALGNGSVSNFTGGSIKWEICGATVQ